MSQVIGKTVLSVISTLFVFSSTHMQFTNKGRDAGGVKLEDHIVVNKQLYPYIVAVLQDKKYICVGTLISTTWVITAASGVIGIKDPTELKIRLASINNHNGGTLLRVNNIILHPNYVKFQPEYDVALLELGNEVILSPDVQSVKNPAKKCPPKVFYLLSWLNDDLHNRDNTITGRKDHNCTVDEHKNEILKQICDLRETVISSDEPIQRLYDKKNSDFTDKGLNMAMGSLPPYKSVKHFLQDARNKSAQVSKTVFKNVGDVEVPVQYKENFWFKVHTPEVFSVYGERQRTNNILESFHSKLNKLLNKNTVTLMRLLNVLQNIHNTKVTPKKRRAAQIINVNFIMEVQMELVHNVITVGHALDKLRT